MKPPPWIKPNKPAPPGQTIRQVVALDRVKSTIKLDDGSTIQVSDIYKFEVGLLVTISQRP